MKGLIIFILILLTILGLYNSCEIQESQECITIIDKTTSIEVASGGRTSESIYYVLGDNNQLYKIQLKDYMIYKKGDKICFKRNKVIWKKYIF
jgi:hypothetical protein